MENKELNLVEILRDCPEGTPLYSPIFGNVTFRRINQHNDAYPIIVNVSSQSRMFTKDGRYCDEFNGECLLFPSKDNRDWSMFKAPRKEYEFKPFDKVLVRDLDGGEWHAEIFSHITYFNNEVRFVCISDYYYQCISYEGNEHLLGTCANPSSL